MKYWCRRVNGAAPGNIDSQPESGSYSYTHAHTHAEGINSRNVNTVRRSPQRAEPRSSDPIQRHRAATRKFRPVPWQMILRRNWGRRILARIRWARCGLVLIGSTLWIAGDGLLDPGAGGLPPTFLPAESYFRHPACDGRHSEISRGEIFTAQFHSRRSC